MDARELGLALDRSGDMPLGVQLAWGLRARIVRGDLIADEQLPPLRDLAQATGVNVNTVRAVYARLERDGLVETRRGSGTFVSTEAGAQRQVAEVVGQAARAAAAAGVDPREVAAALYGSADHGGGDVELAGRHRLREEIQGLERALADLAIAFPDLEAGDPPPRPRRAGRVLSERELRTLRDALIARLERTHRQLVRPDRGGRAAEPTISEPARRKAARSPRVRPA